MKREEKKKRPAPSALSAGVALALCAALTLALTTFAACAPASPASTTTEIDAHLDRAWTTQTREGKVVVFDLNVTNNTTSVLPASVVGSLYAHATQGPSALSEAYLDARIPGVLASSASIAPGESGPAQVAYLINDDSTSVELTVSASTLDFSASRDVLDEKIDPASVESVHSESSYSVGVDDAHVADDGAGKKVLALDMTFTNNSGSPISFGAALKTSLYQAGIGLKSAYLPYNHPARDEELESNAYADVMPGKSIKVRRAYALIGPTDPVELTVSEAGSYDGRAILTKTIEISGAALGGAAV